MAKASEYIVACPDCGRVDVAVDNGKGAWRCYCGQGGDLFDYVMRQEGVDFVGALKLLGFDVEEKP